MVMYGGNQALAVAHGVAERIEASNQEGRDAQPVVLAKRSGNLLGVPTRAVEFQRAPVSRATPVHKRLSSTSPCSAAASRRCEPTFCGWWSQRQTEARTVLADLFEHLGGTLPGGLLGIRDDRPE